MSKSQTNPKSQNPNYNGRRNAPSLRRVGGVLVFEGMWLGFGIWNFPPQAG